MSNKKIKSKKNNLLNYFIYDHKYLSKNYLKNCNNFFKEIEIKKDTPKRLKKDNSKKGDIFLNCRCCGVLIRPDWYSRIDQRYCQDCL